ncbi:alkylation response protein AidB-like acyl-CoA dehydrogenase [Actinoalloteichus hoggarensis]|uniref:Dibenzothiophene desulfurization enzyme C n=1 Tax=Actinoalloteichus hoggarensis TaxID=1470176 RepID=A0A221W3H8_9PSEU|nr:acyl-CoA dehydrogenase family protein [Actinoalloteichus hoggarensis]ASO20209.1 Dibenzothiophene desulfurization enzyme C [Actinoalloteichus hoggarensis]MBB5919078.1 alkylation response protein AidB-like acyl-CoA dehydrogenase [Actinoalloteichus hoggarensis]
MTASPEQPSVPRIADEVAARLRADAVEREHRGAEPVAEIALLRESGLLRLLVPTEHGGLGGDWPTAHRVITTVGAADASIGHLLGYHYFQLWRIRLFDVPEQQARLERASVEGSWFWAGVSNPRDAALVARPVPGGFAVSGRKFFATGASVADRLIASGTEADTGHKIAFTLDAAAEGIRFLGDWDNLGQRLSASGGVEFTDAFVPEGDVLGVQPAPEEPRAWRDSLSPLGFQLLLSRLHVAIAEGALGEAGRYTAEQSRAWPLSGVEAATDDPYVLAEYGRLDARLAAATLLVDAASRAFEDAEALGTGLTAERRGELGVLISRAKVVSTEVVNEIGTRIFELTGARATSARHGLDRYWRNARTLTLHDPVSYKAREIGRHRLTGELPPVTGYS